MAIRTCRPSLAGLELLRQGRALRRRGLALRHGLRQRRRRRLRAAAAPPSHVQAGGSASQFAEPRGLRPARRRPSMRGW